ACLGLLGLASFTAEQRTKEIGIRKVMGASVTSVNTLLSKEFMVLVGISFMIASALAWYAMKEWLSTFAYRIELGPLVFLLGGVVAAGIAWLTVSYHFIKAAQSNPVEALRCE
ncbi:MAG TPA: ABC transporter permease, partial [Chryseolinea sp.]|nr:ABC transporter permease [Chryseolinea sp.]